MNVPCRSCDGEGFIMHGEDSWSRPRPCGVCRGLGQVDGRCVCVVTDMGISTSPDCVVHS